MSLSFIQDFTVVLLVAGLSGSICRRLGASVTIGYLVAGIIVGPYMPPVDLVSDVESIRTLSQLGLIFLMFSTGMSLSFRKIAGLGTGLLVAVACSAVTLTVLLKIGAGLFNASALTALFIAGMLVSSSSAIISRILHEGGHIHRHSGQLAMTFTLLEDLAAIILFGMVGACAAAEKALLVREAGAFFAFLVLAGTLTLLFVPRFLNLIQRRLQQELQTLLVAGLLCLLAVLAARAGYSPALGAFLLGLIIASTPQRAGIERTFTGLRDIFSAVFFVSIGMLIDVKTLMNPWLLLALPILAIAAILLRLVSVSTGLFLAGFKGKVAIPTMLTLTVTGEFSFIFAQLGVERGLLPESTHALVVGACVLTAAFATFIVPRGERVASFLLPRQPEFLVKSAALWRNTIASFGRSSFIGMFWQFTRKRILQIVVEMLLIAGMLIFAQPLYERALGICGRHALRGAGIGVLFWSVFSLLLLLPLIAIWRNVGALALFCAEAADQARAREGYGSAAVVAAIKIAAAILIAGWLWLWSPFYLAPSWILLTLIGVLAIMSILFWRKMVFWHSILEGNVARAVRGGESARVRAWDAKTAEWNLQMARHVMADNSPYGGRSISTLGFRARFNATVVAIERQDFLIMNPAASAVIYPQDELLLLGTAENLSQAREWLSVANQSQTTDEPRVEDIHFESITVPENSPRLGKTLAELGIAAHTGVQIAGIRRAGTDHVSPSAAETLQAGDEILVLGLSRQIVYFREWLEAS